MGVTNTYVFRVGFLNVWELDFLRLGVRFLTFCCYKYLRLEVRFLTFGCYKYLTFGDEISYVWGLPNT